MIVGGVLFCCCGLPPCLLECLAPSKRRRNERAVLNEKEEDLVAFFCFKKNLFV